MDTGICKVLRKARSKINTRSTKIKGTKIRVKFLRLYVLRKRYIGNELKITHTI